MLIAGVDEAGRGPLAGPVFAAAVILKEKKLIKGLNDSKKLSEKRREYIVDDIKNLSTSWSIGMSTAKEIDSINILQASLLAMQRAIENLIITPHQILVDGIYAPKTDIPI